MRLEVSQKYVFSYAGIIRIRFTGQRTVLRNLSRIVRPPEDSFLFTLRYCSYCSEKGRLCQSTDAPSFLSTEVKYSGSSQVTVVSSPVRGCRKVRLLA